MKRKKKKTSSPAKHLDPLAATLEFVHLYKKEKESKRQGRRQGQGGAGRRQGRKKEERWKNEVLCRGKRELERVRLTTSN